MNPHVYLLNGPPRSGKDTAGQILADILPEARVTKFARALKVGTHGLFMAMREQLRPTSVPHVMQDDLMEDSKDDAVSTFFDLTPREAYIAVSERLFKPMFGDEFFGTVLAENMKRGSANAVANWLVTDSGFEAEARPIIRTFGAENITLVRMHRDGCDFAGDSRSYIDLGSAVRTVDIHNNGSIADLIYQVRTML